MKRALLLVTVCLTLSFSAGCVDVTLHAYAPGHGSWPLTELETWLTCREYDDGLPGQTLFDWALNYTLSPGSYVMPAYPGDLLCVFGYQDPEFGLCCTQKDIMQGTTSISLAITCGEYSACNW